MPERDSLPLIGWRELVRIPEWGIKGLRAKIDTGARTSVIDVAEIKELDDGTIRFEVVTRHRPTRKTKWVLAKPVRKSIVRPSSGQAQERHVCRVKIEIGSVEREIEVSLVCRRAMLCRMLLGRTALENLVHVDPSKKYLLSNPSRALSPPKASEGHS